MKEVQLQTLAFGPPPVYYATTLHLVNNDDSNASC